jgi:hypothetical protein
LAVPPDILQQLGFGDFAVDRRYFIVNGRADAIEFLRATHASLQRERDIAGSLVSAGGRAIRSVSKVRAAFASWR